MLINIQPLYKYRDYRLLFLGQFVSYFGNMLTYVALPYQLLVNTLLGPRVWITHLVAGLSSAFNGIHRPTWRCYCLSFGSIQLYPLNIRIHKFL